MLFKDCSYDNLNVRNDVKVCSLNHADRFYCRYDHEESFQRSFHESNFKKKNKSERNVGQPFFYILGVLNNRFLSLLEYSKVSHFLLSI